MTCYVCAKASPVKLYTTCFCFGPFAVGLFVRVSHFKMRQFRSQHWLFNNPLAGPLRLRFFARE